MYTEKTEKPASMYAGMYTATIYGVEVRAELVGNQYRIEVEGGEPLTLSALEYSLDQALEMGARSTIRWVNYDLDEETGADSAGQMGLF